MVVKLIGKTTLMTLLLATAIIPESCFIHCTLQWGTGSCNTIITLPLALSAFKVVFAMHQGTVANTVIISAQEYASSLTQVKFMTNNSNDRAFVMYIVIGR